MAMLHELRSALKDVDMARDLERRSLHVSSDGLSWEDAPAQSTVPRESLLKFFYEMALTRAIDHEILKLMRKGIAYGKHLMCTGNEATAVGAASATRPSDWLTLAIRDLGAFVVRGVPASRLLAQACGRTNGLTDGWDGSLHMGSRDARVIGLVSHLGTLLPVGAGCAFSAVYRGEDTAVLSFSGEGATSTGDFHEGLNIASVMRLPLVVVIENNQWAFGTPTRLQYAPPSLALRALAYGEHVEGYWIDGTNVVTVFQTAARALERARTQGVITIIEAVSMRYEGHSLADPFTTYVPAEQLAKWRRKDPIASLRGSLLSAQVCSDYELDAIDARVGDEVRAAAMEAESGPLPDGTDIESRVFVPGVAPDTSVLRTTTGDGFHVPYFQAIRDALQEEMDRDETVFVIGEDVGISNGAFKITEGFSRRYDGLDWEEVWNAEKSVRQRRVIDAPIAEAGFTGLALGAALNGLRPVVEYQYADFASEAFKMLVNYAATETSRGMGPLPIVFRMPSGWAPNTSIYHSVNPESWFASTPGLKIVAPVSAFDAKGLLKAAIRDPNPVIFLEYKTLYRIRPDRLPRELDLAVPAHDYVVPIGEARVVRPGTNLSIISYGSQLLRAIAAAHTVAREDGIDVEVVDLRTLAPHDSVTINASVRRTGKALVTCEAPWTGTFGHTIVTDISTNSFDYLDAPVKLVAAANTPVPFAPILEQAHLPTEAKLVEAIRTLARY